MCGLAVPAGEGLQVDTTARLCSLLSFMRSKYTGMSALKTGMCHSVVELSVSNESHGE